MSDEQQPEVWPFAPSYEPSYSSLPPSQLRECIKRLSSRARNPLSAEALTQENPEVEGVLSAVRKAYLAKKDRAKLASAAKRAQQKNTTLEPPEVDVAVVESDPAGVDDITAEVADLSLEPAEVVAVEPEPEPEPEPVKPAPSKPIPVPTRIPVVRQQPPAAAAAPRNQPKKVGLAAKFA